MTTWQTVLRTRRLGPLLLAACPEPADQPSGVVAAAGAAEQRVGDKAATTAAILRAALVAPGGSYGAPTAAEGGHPAGRTVV
ncbi:hypothetical protein ACFVXS_37805, partial [Streptomyces sviceus]